MIRLIIEWFILSRSNRVMQKFSIGHREVGLDSAPLVLVEVGINHEGQFQKAIELIDAAVSSGAEVVKFQCHITEKEMIPTDMTPGEISSEKLWDIIKRCELTEEEEIELQRYCEKKNVIYLSTPFSKEAAERLNRMNVPAFKIGSGECNNYPLIEYVAGLGKPIILSTGMNNLDSITKSVKILQKHNVSFALLHCTSMYPTPYEKVRLGCIKDLQETFPGVPVGLSDHSLNIWTCLGAVALGASILEKHFTISRSWPGPDTGISIEPAELADLIVGSQAIWKARGGEKTILSEEKPVIDFAYATVVTIAPIKAGDLFSLDNVWVKRPGLGSISAEFFNEVLNKRAVKDLPVDVHVTPQDIESYECTVVANAK